MVLPIISLCDSTGDPRMDALACAVLARFAGRVRALYVLGSYADGSALATSDVDLTLIVAGLRVPCAQANSAAMRSGMSRAASGVPSPVTASQPGPAA